MSSESATTAISSPLSIPGRATAHPRTVHADRLGPPDSQTSSGVAGSHVTPGHFARFLVGHPECGFRKRKGHSTLSALQICLPRNVLPKSQSHSYPAVQQETIPGQIRGFIVRSKRNHQLAVHIEANRHDGELDVGTHKNI